MVNTYRALQRMVFICPYRSILESSAQHFFAIMPILVGWIISAALCHHLLIHAFTPGYLNALYILALGQSAWCSDLLCLDICLDKKYPLLKEREGYNNFYFEAVLWPSGVQILIMEHSPFRTTFKEVFLKWEKDFWSNVYFQPKIYYVVSFTHAVIFLKPTLPSII